jgi:hypothetical protein
MDGRHPGPLGVLVCLCGALQRPRLAGQRETATARSRLESFTTSFDLAEDVHRLDDIAEKYGERLLPRGVDYDLAGEFLGRIAQEVERYAGRARLKRVAVLPIRGGSRPVPARTPSLSICSVAGSSFGRPGVLWMRCSAFGGALWRCTSQSRRG